LVANWRRSSIANTCGCRCTFICGLSDVLVNEYLFIYLFMSAFLHILATVFTCAPAMLRAGIVFGGVCLSVCLSAQNLETRLLIRN